MNLTQSNIQIFSFSNGETIIGIVDNINGTILYPLMVCRTEPTSEDPSSQILLYPYTALSDHHVLNYYSEHVSTLYTADEKGMHDYIQLIISLEIQRANPEINTNAVSDETFKGLTQAATKTIMQNVEYVLKANEPANPRSIQ